MDMTERERKYLASILEGRTPYRPLAPGEKRNNPDGSYSTEILASEYMPDGTIANFPTLWMGGGGPVELPLGQAAASALQFEAQNQRPLPRFNSIEEAIAAAKARSHSGGGSKSSLFKPSRHRY